MELVEVVLGFMQETFPHNRFTINEYGYLTISTGIICSCKHTIVNIAHNHIWINDEPINMYDPNMFNKIRNSCNVHLSTDYHRRYSFE